MKASRPDGDTDWVVWLAGAGAPPEVTFADCIRALPHGVRSLPKGLELFEDVEGPPEATTMSSTDYSFTLEVDGVLRAMDELGIERAHVVGYSGGGGVALALALQHPGRIRTLAVDEPVAGFRLGVEDEDEFWADLDAALRQEGLAATLGVVEATNAPGAAPPALEDPPPSWLRSRITGTPRLAAAARAHRVSRDDLLRLRCPVYATYGSATRNVYRGWAEAIVAAAGRGAVEAYDGCDHARPAHQRHPDRYAAALLALWGAAPGHERLPSSARPDRARHRARGSR